MDTKELELKISHFESMIIARQESLDEFRNSNLTKNLVFNSSCKEVRDVVKDFIARTKTKEVEYEDIIEKLQDGLSELRLELEKIDKKLSISTNSIRSPSDFTFDMLGFQNLLNQNKELGMKDFSRRQIGRILRCSDSDRGKITFPDSLRLLNIVFALNMDLELVREQFNIVNSMKIVGLKENQTPNSQQFFQLKLDKTRAFAEALQLLLFTKTGCSNPKYSEKNLQKARFPKTTYSNFIAETEKDNVRPVFTRFETLFKIETDIKKHIPNFDFSSVIKYNPPNDVGL
jgi:hypothetical protein